ncbi:ParB/RepB/Spo0J family partition protein [Corynebacterium uterequi]|uniref:Putative transcriptional regulator n=1 Tax=Corynebacterium uterequi TaxID=1072256 RepID=A0A0G3HHF9_9CORY|nr:ParB/RepB/Spo0J family partition protein [Corynebacterium uterequi]AKK12190.1 putative transcriptional regulator [Corynebacterium uterequi]
MSNKPRKGGLGRGLGALIPSGPGPGAGDAPRPRLGAGAADVIFGETTRPQSGDRIKGAPIFTGDSEKASRSIHKAVAVDDAEDYGASYAELPIGSITPNARNPRRVFDADELAELVHSIKEVGLLQPVVVRKISDGYELIMGERRWRAAAKAGLKRIPAIVREAADDTMLRDALLENIHRVQLNPLEEAAAYQQLLEEFGVTQAELAERLGRSRPVITNTIRLMQLPVGVQSRVAAGVLSAGHARALLGVKVDDATDAQEHLADRIIREGLSVRATEEAVTILNRDGHTAPEKKKRQPQPQPEYATAAAERLADSWDTKVSVLVGKRKGKIVVEFGDQEDLQRLLALMNQG